MNLCINCQHFFRSLRGNAQCRRDSTPSPVDGNPAGAIYQCLDERSESGACGVEGKFFGGLVVEHPLSTGMKKS